MTTIKFLEHFPGHHILISMKEDSSKAPIHYHDEYSDKMAARLHKVNDQGDIGIFFTVNLLNESKDKGRHRTKKMVTHARAVFMDADDPVDSPLTDFPLSPSLVVSTSPKKYHYYWLIDGMTDDLQTWNLVQRGLIVKYNGDDNAKDMTRYLRLPGYDHNKTDIPYEVTWEGSGVKYSWSEICEAFPPSTESKSVAPGKGNMIELSEHQTEDELDEIIRSGDHGMHQAINKRMLGMKRDGVPLRVAMGYIRAVGYELAKSADDRIASRFSDKNLIRSYENAPDDKEIELPDVAPPRQVYDPGEFPWPPGFLGELAQIAYNNQLYQHREIAVISAIGLIAGICGRKFNFHRTGLNVYLTLIMRTGGGKDAIGDFISGVLGSLNPFGTQSTHIGPQRFTGPKAVINALTENLCIVCVFSEAGLLLKSKAGDKDGLSRSLLSLYSKSATGKWSGTEVFSHEDNSIKSLPSPCLSIVNEATPETLLDALAHSGALEKGELPRQSIYRADKDKPAPNPNYGTMDFELEDELRTRLIDLVKTCKDAQTSNNPEPYIMELHGDIRNRTNLIMEHYRNIENQYVESDPRRSIMASRAAVKVMKFAALASVFNQHKDLTIRQAEWDWAEDMVDYEMKGLDFFFQGSGGNELDDLVRSYIGKQIWKIIKGKAGKGVSQSDEKQRKLGIFPLSGLRAICRKNSKLAAIGDDTEQRSKPIDGMHKVIEYMKMVGLLVDVSTTERKLLKITQDFRNMMYYENK